VERGLIYPPVSFIGGVTPADRDRLTRSSTVYGHYEKTLDRESAYELLKKRAMEPVPAGSAGKESATRGGRTPETMTEAMIKSAVRAAGSQMGRSLIRGVLGSILGRR
jgi:hypothetical protein